MRIVAWNVQAGGGTRTVKVVDALLTYDADILILAETTWKRRADLCGPLHDRGYVWGFGSRQQPQSDKRGICVLSRNHQVRLNPPAQVAQLAKGWVDVDLGGLVLSAVYAPATGPELETFWRRMAEWASTDSTPRLLIGDLNVGLNRIDAPDHRFKGGVRFADFLQAGFVDLWRRDHPNVIEPTWYSRRAGGAVGKGFRIDHALATQNVTPRVLRCHYSHREREAGLSDHSVLVVDLNQYQAAE